MKGNLHSTCVPTERSENGGTTGQVWRPAGISTTNGFEDAGRAVLRDGGFSVHRDSVGSCQNIWRGGFGLGGRDSTDAVGVCTYGGVRVGSCKHAKCSAAASRVILALPKEFQGTTCDKKKEGKRKRESVMSIPYL